MNYEEQNAKGYEGDEYVHKELTKLVKQFKIRNIVETGTYKGHTTNRLSDLAHVVSFEKNIENYKEARKNYPKLEILCIDSVRGLQIMLPLHNALFFLDAHWKGTPLLQELNMIREYKLKPVIVIHDFKVPGRDDLGFDSYDGQDYTWEWIKPSIEAIYGKDYEYYYNDKAEGAKRGLIYILPNVSL